MSFILPYIENACGYIFYNFKGRDDGLFSKTCKPVSSLEPTVTLTSTELGSSPGTFTAKKHELLGDNLFPQLSWTSPASTTSKTKSWLLVVEDADVPLPTPIVHGIYYNIPPSKTSLQANDFDVKKGAGDDGKNDLIGGFKYGVNRQGTVYIGPRPILGHGPHRYFFQLVGLNVETPEAEGQSVKKEDLVKEGGLLEGKVVCWGSFTASFERRLGQTANGST